MRAISSQPIFSPTGKCQYDTQKNDCDSYLITLQVPDKQHLFETCHGHYHEYACLDIARFCSNEGIIPFIPELFNQVYLTDRIYKIKIDERTVQDGWCIAHFSKEDIPKWDNAYVDSIQCVQHANRTRYCIKMADTQTNKTQLCFLDEIAELNNLNYDNIIEFIRDYNYLDAIHMHYGFIRT